MSRFDVFKSLVRQGLDRASDRVSESTLGEGLGAASQRIRELLVDRELLVPLRTVSDAISYAEGAEEVGVSVIPASADEPAGLHVDARFSGRREGTSDVSVTVRVDSILLAPRGAKELRFRVTPPEATRDPHVREIVSVLAGIVAHTLWSFIAGPPPRELGGAFVESSDPGMLQVDLRSVPALRGKLRGGPAVMVLDALSLDDASFEEAGLRLRLNLPTGP